jgi:hypothetical protein
VLLLGFDPLCFVVLMAYHRVSRSFIGDLSSIVEELPVMKGGGNQSFFGGCFRNVKYLKKISLLTPFLAFRLHAHQWNTLCTTQPLWRLSSWPCIRSSVVGAPSETFLGLHLRRGYLVLRCDMLKLSLISRNRTHAAVIAFPPIRGP